VPFRVPSGIKLIRIDPKTGMRLAAGSGGGLLEAFKPGTAPPDSYAIVGYDDPNNPNPQPNRSFFSVSPDADRAVQRGNGLY